MAAFAKAPMKTVSLEKVRDLTGNQPLGAIYNWTYKSDMNDFLALGRATAALKRDHPDENPLDWKVIT